ncbi:MAG TPA: hypothetical protein VI461_03975, partial [Chitinophagaceae bacterium]|nr:hypothetical protein [Chitinophagaceae bacterium]
MLHLYGKKGCKLTGSFLLFGFICFAQTLLAQEREIYQEYHDSKPYYFGITLAGNVSRFHTEQHSRFLGDDSIYVAQPNNSGGFGLGLLATARLSD